MKWFVGILVVLLLSSSLVFAGESYDLDLSELRTQAIFMYEGDEVRLSLLGGNHSIIIEDVGSSSVKLNIVPFMNEGNPEVWPGLLGLDTINKIDLDEDGVEDLNIALYGIEADGQVHLVLQDVAQVDSDLTGDAGVVDAVDGMFDEATKSLLLKIVGVLAVVLLLFLVFRGKKEGAVAEAVSLPDEVDEALGDASLDTSEKPVVEEAVVEEESAEEASVEEEAKKESASEEKEDASSEDGAEDYI